MRPRQHRSVSPVTLLQSFVCLNGVAPSRQSNSRPNFSKLAIATHDREANKWTPQVTLSLQLSNEKCKMSQATIRRQHRRRARGFAKYAKDSLAKDQKQLLCILAFNQAYPGPCDDWNSIHLPFPSSQPIAITSLTDLQKRTARRMSNVPHGYVDLHPCHSR
jgi:hypothetical protein